ncbi:unnamed protein product, partial [Didymodactylos carnosus]
LPSTDPFFYLGSKYSRSDDIATVFDRAIRRELHYEENRMDTRCVVFLDEAGLPDENKMVLKVLHSYLDDSKVAFIAVSNKLFDAANANRMMCVYRSLPSEDDQMTLAYGCCLGKKYPNDQVQPYLNYIITGLCKGYRQVLKSPDIPRIFHDRDFIYMLRELRFELSTPAMDMRTMTDPILLINGITPLSLLRALENNFNGIKRSEFEILVKVFFDSIQHQCGHQFDFKLPQKHDYRNTITILRDSMMLDPLKRRQYGRYKLVIDESEDESASRLLYQVGILDPNTTTEFRMSDFIDDVNNELRNAEILSTIKLCMERGKTISMINTQRIHGSLYDVFNQNFSIMATGETRKIFSKVAFGPKTLDVPVHEEFQCIVHIKRSEFKDIPAPFLSRFQKYSLSIDDFYRIQLEKLPMNMKNILNNVERKVQSFIDHYGKQHFYGLTDSSLCSILLSFIKLKSYEHQLTPSDSNLEEQKEEATTNAVTTDPQYIPQSLHQPQSLPTFEDPVSSWLCMNYVYDQEHFNLENFVQLLVTTQNTNTITTKVTIYTRTSSYILGLNERTKSHLFTNDNSSRIDILNLSVINNETDLREKFDLFKNDKQQDVLIIVINAKHGTNREHIPYVRELIDKTECTNNILNNLDSFSSDNIMHLRTMKQQQQFLRKYFIMLLHSPSQEIFNQSYYPSIYLYDWDFYFFDTCTPNTAFHLQKMLSILCSSSKRSIEERQQQTTNDNVLCDLNVLFDESIWEFCSRLEILMKELPLELKKSNAYDFYERNTNIAKRVNCLKQIIQKCPQFQQRIVNTYHEHLSKNNHSMFKLIYETAKQILCGQRFDGLVDSIHLQITKSFTNFMSYVLKNIVNDYALTSLWKTSTNGFESMLNLIDYLSFESANNQGDDIYNQKQNIAIQVITHYSYIPLTPLFHLFHQRIETYANELKINNLLQHTHSYIESASLITCSQLGFGWKTIYKLHSGHPGGN